MQDLKDSGHHDYSGTQGLAYWTTTSMLGWLHELEMQGKARKILDSGYPLRYTARARDVLPLLADEALLGMGVWPHTGKSLYPDRIAACPGDQLLIIDAMDQS
ncbi:hypothetical protein OOK31_35845 [Streptomyces sp. NBC_00249]|uniref:hypothetical protein n=1 Tax=Streptomyces sp. NBC_00249 TaxID=2975690 RepID=UPI00224C8199|nr:hypothetical protein [Streptomyces sp. NBC_00249]MCX5199195.1 hypothetical protein [Streptomyces sp. NBC_00249]